MNVLKNIFSSTKDEIWSEFAQEIGATYSFEGVFRKKNSRLVYNYKNWEIILDTENDTENGSTFTRARVAFNNNDNLYFKIRSTNFSPFLRFFIRSSFEIGDFSFDDRYIVSGNKPEKIKLLLDSLDFKHLMLFMPSSCVLKTIESEGLFSKRYENGISLLYFRCFGLIKTKKELKTIIEVFKTLLDRLILTKSTDNFVPQIEIKPYYSMSEILKNYKDNILFFLFKNKNKNVP